MHKSLRFISFLLILISSSSYTKPVNVKKDQVNGFVINGTVTGFKDHTWIYLEDGSNKNLIKTDSALIIAGKFQFKGKLSIKTIHVILQTKNPSDYIFFWLENSIISFKAEKGHFEQATINGSKTQLDERKLNTLIQPLRNAEDSISKLRRIEKSEIRKADLKKELEVLNSQEEEVYKLFIKNNPNSIISASDLSIYATTWGKAVVIPLYSNFSKEIKNSPYGKDIAAYLKLNKGLKIGDHYADFVQQNLSGKMIKFSDYAGKLILLEFWGSWCAPCREGNPELVKTYNKFKEKGFEVFGVAADSEKTEWLQAIAQDKLSWPQVCDLKGAKNDAVLIYGINKFPSNFLIDEKGIIIAQDLRGEDLQKKLVELLK